MTSKKVINPETHKSVNVEGKTFQALLKKGYKYNTEKNILERCEVPKKNSSPERELTVETLWEGPPLQYLIHISDVHIPIGIREKGREEEYKGVFLRLMAEIKGRVKVKNQGAAIVITGDLLDTKIKLEPLTIIIAREFLLSLSSLYPIILIAGNHDMNEYNLSTPCTLSALCHKLGDRIFYLEKTGLYKAPGVLFSLSSLKDKGFIPFCEIKPSLYKDLTVVALYHGTISGSLTDGGYRLDQDGSSRFRSKENFSGYPMVLLGDIHKHQSFQTATGKMAYSGSLLQINCGESLNGHGFLIWNLATRDFIHVEVENEYGFIKIPVANGVPQFESLPSLPKYPRFICQILHQISLDSSNHDPALIREILEKEYHAVEVRFNEMKRSVALPALDDLQFIPEEYHALHKQISHSEGMGGVGMGENYWYLQALEFKNLFSYGGDHTNKIEFKEGVYNISAPNRYGKSSLCNVILFALFEHMKGKECLNKGAKSGYVKLWFNCNSQDYCVERKCSRSSSKVSLYRNETNITGINATETNMLLRSLVGTHETFISCNALIPRVDKSLLRMGVAERLRYLEELFGLQRFEGYSKKVREMRIPLAREEEKHKREMEQLKLSRLSNPQEVKERLEFLESREKELEEEFKRKKKEREEIRFSINELQMKIGSIKALVKCHNDGPLLELPEILAGIERCEEQCRGLARPEYSSEQILAHMTLMNKSEQGLREEIEKYWSSKPNEVERLPIKGDLYYWREKYLREYQELKECSRYEVEPAGEIHLQIQQLESQRLEHIRIPPKKREFREEELREKEEVFLNLERIQQEKETLISHLQSLKPVNSKITITEEMRDRICAALLTKNSGKDYYSLKEEIEEMKAAIAHNREVDLLMKREAEIAEHNCIIGGKVRYLQVFSDLNLSLRNYKNLEAWARFDAWRAKEEEIKRGTELLNSLMKCRLFEKLDSFKEQLQRLENLRRVKDMEEQVVSLEEEMEVLKEREGELESHLITVKSELVRIEGERSSLNHKYQAHLQGEEGMAKLSDKLSSITKEIKLLDNYSLLIEKRGIPFKILNERLKTLETAVNEIFHSKTGYLLKLECQNEKVEISIQVGEDAMTPQRLSGAEDALLNISLKAMMSSLCSSRSSLFIVDEILDCLDKINWKKVLPELFQTLKVQYGTVLFISHRNISPELVDGSIIIAKEGANSRIL